MMMLLCLYVIGKLIFNKVIRILCFHDDIVILAAAIVIAIIYVHVATFKKLGCRS